MQFVLQQLLIESKSPTESPIPQCYACLKVEFEEDEEEEKEISALSGLANIDFQCEGFVCQFK